MTQEEKAKAYDRVAKEVKDFFEGRQKMYSDVERTLEYLFPELKESEDERIKKTLIDYFKTYKKQEECGINTFFGIPTDNIIAWVEKQGEKKSVDDLTQQEAMDIAVAKCFERGEEKPVDKTKPKFKVGDWITNGATKPAQISSIEDDMYYTHNGTIGGDIESMDKDYHLWTIADAKDGDVLSDGTTIFIFKDLLSDDSVISHCDYDTDSGKGYVFCPLSMNLTCSKITPATKEQCNLLFQKIKENGYEWDAEKKELKKIEQKPTQETKPFKVEHGKYYYCIKDCFCGGKKQASKGDVIQALRGLPIMSLKDASEYFLPVNFIKEIW